MGNDSARSLTFAVRASGILLSISPGPQPQREQEQGCGFKAQDAGTESSGCEVVVQEQPGLVFGQAAFGAEHGDAARRVDQLGGLDEFRFFLFPAK